MSMTYHDMSWKRRALVFIISSPLLALALIATVIFFFYGCIIFPLCLIYALFEVCKGENLKESVTFVFSIWKEFVSMPWEIYEDIVWL